MNNVSYHGTDSASALKIVGPPPGVDINIGKGELGKGFYTGSSIALAAIWAQLRYNNDAVVIKFDIPEPRFVQLKGYVVKTQVEVFDGWTSLKATSETTTFSFGYDYIVAPFATIQETGHQYKFESQKAEDELNASHKSVYPCAS